jgi:hypothetical protein
MLGPELDFLPFLSSLYGLSCRLSCSSRTKRRELVLAVRRWERLVWKDATVATAKLEDYAIEGMFRRDLITSWSGPLRLMSVDWRSRHLLKPDGRLVLYRAERVPRRF